MHLSLYNYHDSQTTIFPPQGDIITIQLQILAPDLWNTLYDERSIYRLADYITILDRGLALIRIRLSETITYNTQSHTLTLKGQRSKENTSWKN